MKSCYAAVSRGRSHAVLGVAFAGSLFFGWSLGWATQASLAGSALWLTVGAGAGWAALLPVLFLWTKLSWQIVLRACLVTICFGEAVLVLGGLGNLASVPNPIYFNACVVLVSNLVMAATLCRKLADHGVPAWRTIAAWTLALNGTGALAFWLLRFLLRGGR